MVSDKTVAPAVKASNVRVKHISLTGVAKRVSSALNQAGLTDGGLRHSIVMNQISCLILLLPTGGAGREKFYTDLDHHSLKPFYGAMFRDLLADYTHWGWLVMNSCLTAAGN